MNECGDKFRFPSGPWRGYWEQNGRRARMRLHLSFVAGRISGEGRDAVGDFVFSGAYDANGVCSMLKTYLGQHDVDYDGQPATRGIRGEWRIGANGATTDVGEFHIWPVRDGAGAADSAVVELAVPAVAPVGAA